MSVNDILVEQILAEKQGSVIAVREDETVQGAAQVLTQKRIGLLVVLSEARKFVGLLSERDIIRAVASKPHLMSVLMVSDLVTRNVVACDPKATAREVMDTMKERKFRHMPVVENGKIRGVISRTDLLNHIAAEDDDAAAAAA